MAILRRRRQGIPILRLVGEVGWDDSETFSRELAQALGEGAGGVLLDLRSTRHLHYRLAGLLVEMSRSGGRVRLVGPSPYVRQILRFAGAMDGEPEEYPSLGEAADHAA